MTAGRAFDDIACTLEEEMPFFTKSIATFHMLCVHKMVVPFPDGSLVDSVYGQPQSEPAAAFL